MPSRGRASLADMKPQAKNDAYTVMLTISLIAMVLACVLLYNDIHRYPTLKPPAVAPLRGAGGGGGGDTPDFKVKDDGDAGDAKEKPPATNPGAPPATAPGGNP